MDVHCSWRKEVIDDAIRLLGGAPASLFFSTCLLCGARLSRLMISASVSACKRFVDMCARSAASCAPSGMAAALFDSGVPIDRSFNPQAKNLIRTDSSKKIIDSVQGKMPLNFNSVTLHPQLVVNPVKLWPGGALAITRQPCTKAITILYCPVLWVACPVLPRGVHPLPTAVPWPQVHSIQPLTACHKNESRSRAVPF